MRSSRWLLPLSLVCCAAASSACGDDDPAPSRGSSAADEAALPQAVHLAGGLGWEAIEPLVYQPPSNELRDAEYTAREHPEVVLTVSAFEPHFGGGGSVQGNVDRWIGQVEAPGGQSSRAAANISTFERNDLEITRVDISGTFIGRRGTGQDMRAHPGWRLLGAIVEGGPEGLVFFKMTGPEEGVAAAEQAFAHVLDSVHLE